MYVKSLGLGFPDRDGSCSGIKFKCRIYGSEGTLSAPHEMRVLGELGMISGPAVRKGL